MLDSRECGKRCRMAFGEFYKSQWGIYKFLDRKIIFKENEVFALYSDFHEKTSGWFYDVPKIEWEDWQVQSLLFLMKEGNEVNYLILNPKEAKTLLNKIKPASKGLKKINIRRPANGGKVYIIEWHDLPLVDRLQSLNVSWTR